MISARRPMHLLNRIGNFRHQKRAKPLTLEEKQNITLNNHHWCNRHAKAYERECIKCKQELI